MNTIRPYPVCLCLLLCLCTVYIGGCATRGSRILVQPVRSVPHIQPVAMPAEARLWVDVTSTAGDDLRGLLIALLQSEKDMRLAHSAKDAQCILRVTVREVALTDSRTLGPSFETGASGATWGLLTGAILGSAAGGRGLAWGAGIGALVGLTLGLGSSADRTALVWAMRADVVVERQNTLNGLNGGQKTVLYQGEMLAVAEGVDMERADALATLENLLAREIVNALTTEGS